ncbi:hypothetical protein D9M68_17960 [compost metagenome]
MSNEALKQAFAPRYTVSLESAANGETVVEREYEIYGTIEDTGVLAAATGTEFQEQWGMPCNEGAEYGIFGNIRVRKTTKGENEVEHTQTIKVKEEEGNDENEIEIGEATFDIFKKLVPNGLLKTRYFFPVPDSELIFQVDVFQDTNGVQCMKVKIDLEVPEGVVIDQVTLPFKLTDVRVIKPGKKGPEDTDFVRSLFSKHYESTNPYYIK